MSQRYALASGLKLLKGHTALLTGASRGIGNEMAHRLTEEGVDKLILVAHPWHKADLEQVSKEVAECKTCGGTTVEQHVVDFANPQEVDRLAQQCANKGVSVLINNAGIMGGREMKAQGPLEGNPDDWEKTMQVNALAPMRLMRALAPGMAQRGDGYIINISNVEAKHTGAHHAAYAASKWALSGFSAASYEDLRQQGVRVVDIAPGSVHGTGQEEKSDRAGGQGAVEPRDVVEAAMLPFRMSKNAVPEEVVIKALRPGN